jgi:hypothetical protein
MRAPAKLNQAVIMKYQKDTPTMYVTKLQEVDATGKAQRVEVKYLNKNHDVVSTDWPTEILTKKPKADENGD